MSSGIQKKNLALLYISIIHFLQRPQERRVHLWRLILRHLGVKGGLKLAWNRFVLLSFNQSQERNKN